jgi:hypothetical protein
MSTGEHVKPSRAHATSKLAKRKIDNLMHSNQVANREDKAAYNSFDEPIVTGGGADLMMHGGQNQLNQH